MHQGLVGVYKAANSLPETICPFPQGVLKIDTNKSLPLKDIGPLESLENLKLQIHVDGHKFLITMINTSC